MTRTEFGVGRGAFGISAKACPLGFIVSRRRRLAGNDAICNLGVADWHGREAIRENLRAFIDTGFTAHHDVVEYWDGGSLKVFRGIVTMIPDDKSKPTVRPTMSHFFYMDEKDPTKVGRWIGAVGPAAFS